MEVVEPEDHRLAPERAHILRFHERRRVGREHLGQALAHQMLRTKSHVVEALPCRVDVAELAVEHGHGAVGNRSQELQGVAGGGHIVLAGARGFYTRA
jgi:hypothetical protein